MCFQRASYGQGSGDPTPALEWPSPATVDLDVDSLNEFGLGFPSRPYEEDASEMNAPGKIFVVNSGDVNNNGIPDYAYFDFFHTNLPLIPVVLN